MGEGKRSSPSASLIKTLLLGPTPFVYINFVSLSLEYGGQEGRGREAGGRGELGGRGGEGEKRFRGDYVSAEPLLTSRQRRADRDC